MLHIMFLSISYLAGNDVNNKSLLNYAVYYCLMNNNITVNISNLTQGVTYNLYYGVSNEGFPKFYSTLYGNYITTSNATASTGGTTNTHGERNRGLLMASLIIMIIFLMIF